MLALLVSLGGTATAAHLLITSQDIQDGTIRLADLSTATKTSLHSHAVEANIAGYAEHAGTLNDLLSFQRIPASRTPTPGAFWRWVATAASPGA